MVSVVQTSTNHYYKIEYFRRSEASWLLFTRHTVTGKRLVIKMLREYHDNRYNFTTVDARQKSQIEALRWNKKFTHGVYLGLARLYFVNLKQKIIGIGEIIKRLEQKDLDPKAEYVLLMRQLPKRRRLDQLLKAKDSTLLYNDVRLVTEYVAKMHRKLPSLPAVQESEIRWGGPEQLSEKLAANLVFFDKILAPEKKGQYDSYSFLKETMRRTLENPQYRQYFEKRIPRYIKRCHGDLKSTNIWVTQYYDRREQKSRKNVKLLDAIDFNASFSNIDVLSDFAMLVIDVQARTQLPELAGTMIEEYLAMTRQQDESARFLLKYYLVEKAMVGAVINIIFDRQPELGVALLNIATLYAAELLTENATENA